MSEKLKPCPFCNYPGYIDGDGSGYSPYCSNIKCPVLNDDGWTKEASIRVWNTRPIEDALKAELARKDIELAECQCAAHMRETELLTKQDNLGFDLDAIREQLTQAEAERDALIASLAEDFDCERCALNINEFPCGHDCVEGVGKWAARKAAKDVN